MAEPSLKYARVRGDLSPAILPCTVIPIPIPIPIQSTNTSLNQEKRTILPVPPSQASQAPPSSPTPPSNPKKVTSSSMGPSGAFCVFGFSDSSLLFASPDGNSLLSPLSLSHLKVMKEAVSSPSAAITATCLDASGAHLLAVTRCGRAAVYSIGWVSNSNSTNSNSNSNSKSNSTLFAEVSSTNSIFFKYTTSSSSSITCGVLDPAYSQKTDKTLVVGTSDGSVILTKRGWLGRRDVTLYQGSSSSGGIISVAWRGDHLAFSDATGVKIIDVVSGVRIAKVDRPAGANPALYKNVITGNEQLPCLLQWEKEDRMLIGWGDCLMCVEVVEEPTVTTATGASSQNSVGKAESFDDVNSASNKSVRCIMAWELDAVCVGVVPLDSGSVALLGVVVDEDDDGDGDIEGTDDLETTKNSDDDDNDNDNDNESITTPNTTPNTNNIQPLQLELQIISRTSGLVISCDSLPLHTYQNEIVNPMEYQLLSSYQLSRAKNRDDNNSEGPPQIVDGKEEFERWSLGILESDSESDSDSDYDADSSHHTTPTPTITPSLSLSRSSHTTTNPLGSLPLPPPPIMTITSPRDVICVRTRDVDDKVAFARLQNNPRLALTRALSGRRSLRKFALVTLINEYLEHLLVNGEFSLAARETTRLLGVNVTLWERWMYAFAKSSDGIFALSSKLPVRDPKLSSSLYEMALEKMMLYVELENGDEEKAELFLRR